MSEELVNRQFQLERLSDEGKPLCEEIHLNNEQVLYEAEGEEPQDQTEQSLEDYIRRLLEQEEGQPVEISRHRFISSALGTAELLNQEIIKLQLRLHTIEQILAAERRSTAFGSRIIYLEHPDGSCSFKAMEKEPIGFRPKGKVEDSQTWLDTQQEREAKKNEPAQKTGEG